MIGLVRAIGRGIDRFCDVLDNIGAPPEWRVQKHEDGLYYVEWEHMDQGWVYDPPGYGTLIDAAAAGRRRYERREA